MDTKRISEFYGTDSLTGLRNQVFGLGFVIVIVGGGGCRSGYAFICSTTCSSPCNLLYNKSDTSRLLNRYSDSAANLILAMVLPIGTEASGLKNSSQTMHTI